MAYKSRLVSNPDDPNMVNLPLPKALTDLLNIEIGDSVIIKTDGKGFYLEKETSSTTTNSTISEKTNTPPISNQNYEQLLGEYWEIAAQEGMREKFMGTLRPLLRAKLNYDYSEVICEKEARKLCLRYYQARERGEKFEGPYIPDWQSIGKS